MVAIAKKHQVVFIVAIAALGAGSAFMLLADSGPSGRIRRVDESSLPLRPAHLPAAALLVVSAGSLLLLLERRPAKGASQEQESSAEADASESSRCGVISNIAVTVAYVISLPLVGFVISSTACITAISWVLGIRDIRWLVIAPLSFVVLIWGVFHGLLAMPLP
ncbi:Tripartite tricarboxylate transporter TctB family protein [Posidoniimonas polymericola]|uniref:Tripartite tricarboxylate transporter TctB family protein n=1 Tax=Posidoniimonas polymericola TaxID=2528002 RepID=A0A5C5XWQ2_9BACT|nr:tripartite tricarboxylate transporter TctB family protein [Posidoniimonas polymericola]TWT66939.1 Tripartite tricarboxylate transporter TctB family protein [Posidoniimonas polymericola]